jgi:hypothetical protein
VRFRRFAGVALIAGVGPPGFSNGVHGTLGNAEKENVRVTNAGRRFSFFGILIKNRTQFFLLLFLIGGCSACMEYYLFSVFL